MMWISWYRHGRPWYEYHNKIAWYRKAYHHAYPEGYWEHALTLFNHWTLRWSGR